METVTNFEKSTSQVKPLRAGNSQGPSERVKETVTPQNTSPTNKTFSQNQQDTDSSQVCHIKLSGVRKHTSIRCDETIWKAFKTLCSANGLSTCDILEKLLIGFCYGFQMRVAQSTTIYVVVDAPRVVKRVRRRQLVYESEIEEVGSRRCCVMGCSKSAFEHLVDVDGKEWFFCREHSILPLQQGYKRFEEVRE